MKGTRTVDDSDDKCNKRRRSKGKTKLGQDDTVDTAKRNQVGLSLITPNVSLVPTVPILSKRHGERQLHGLATLAQRFVQIVTVSKDLSTIHSMPFACILLTVPPHRPLVVKKLIWKTLSTCWVSASDVYMTLSTFWKALVSWRSRDIETSIDGSPKSIALMTSSSWQKKTAGLNMKKYVSMLGSSFKLQQSKQ